MKRKPNLAARIERCAHLLITAPELLRGRWLENFGYSELRVELGCGKGRFSVEAARAEPGVLFVALEKSDNVLVIALERAAAEGLRNLLFINVLADDLPEFFAPGEVSRIYINFCDPWPANRHSKRRLTGPRFLELYRQVLRRSGDLHFKTDNLPLFEFSLREFTRNGFLLVDTFRDLHGAGPVGIMTDYELKFHNMGMPICKCIIKPIPDGLE